MFRLYICVQMVTRTNTSKWNRKQTNFKLSSIPFSFAMLETHESIEHIDTSFGSRQRCWLCVDIKPIWIRLAKIGSVIRKPLEPIQNPYCLSFRCYCGSRSIFILKSWNYIQMPIKQKHTHAHRIHSLNRTYIWM